MVHIPGAGMYDLSFIASLNCNLQCPHCQYSAGPDQSEWLDMDMLNHFLGTVDWDAINSVGFYGGEISVNLERWILYIESVSAHTEKPRWCITNGSWSRDALEYTKIIWFAARFDLTIFISTTPWHKTYQDDSVLRHLVEKSEKFHFKKDDTRYRLLPMGRNYRGDWYCTGRCKEDDDPKRLAILPNADVIYQSCDGVYPTIMNIAEEDVTWLYIESAMRDLQCPRNTGEV